MNCHSESEAPMTKVVIILSVLTVLLFIETWVEERKEAK
jgi:hypothetical protein